MKISSIKHSRKGFTLVELIIAMAIFGIMSTTTLMVYFNISETSRRLQISREISESARQITEHIAQNIRESGIAIDAEKYDNSIGNFAENYESDYMGSGSAVLPIEKKNSSNQNFYYVYGKKDSGGIKPCTDADKQDLTVHCGLYFTDKNEAKNLVDAFRENEDQKRVKISDLKFYISGGDSDAKKVTLKMTLQLTQKSGVSPSLINSSKMEIQTTFSDRPYN